MNRIGLLIILDLYFWVHAIEAKVAAYLGQLLASGGRALEELRRHKLIRGVGAGINERRQRLLERPVKVRQRDEMAE